MNFSRGCSSVLSIMESIPKMSPISLSGGSGSDGYHSDPDHSDEQKYFDLSDLIYFVLLFVC